ncbi:DNA-binding transcriptional MerR regulator [Actinoalloteichus hoggarensis]|nr:MerR family DNA-binding transcriptional regulator [Actinoalloteichus hoggarensis]MBB5922099.1 DNA-binding transcriptional MerR regulator [Actinoalloteichus hoggarensis]
MGVHVGASIGQAAALFDIAPSTLRWWEKTGLLPAPPRVNGRRVYDEQALRRVGVAYLCCLTGAMPLSQAASVTTGQAGKDWQENVSSQVARLDGELRRLRNARDYLLHLLRCPDDDVVAECTHLAGELAEHTPVGDVAVGDGLVAAARSLRPRGSDAVRDEKTRRRDEDGAGQARCAVCGDALATTARGRPRKYCSQACRQRRYRRSAASS